MAIEIRGKVKVSLKFKPKSSSKKLAIITVGIPGSGKTTWAEQQKGYVNLNLDDFREKISGDATNQNVSKQAVEMRDAFLRRASEKQQNVIISDTNINPFFREKLELQLKQAGYTIQHKIFDIDLDEAKIRNSKREHKVPEDVVEKMHSSLQSQINSNTLVSNNVDIIEINNDVFKVHPHINVTALVKQHIHDASKPWYQQNDYLAEQERKASAEKVIDINNKPRFYISEDGVARGVHGIMFNLRSAVAATGLSQAEFARQHDLRAPSLNVHIQNTIPINESSYNRYKEIFNLYNIELPAFRLIDSTTGLKVIRDFSGFSGAQIAKALKVDTSLVHDVESGAINNPKIVRDMLHIYGYTPEDFNRLNLTSETKLWELAKQCDPEIPRVLRHIRERLGFTATQISRNMGKVPSFTSALERGQNFSIRNIAPLLQQYSISVTDFLGLMYPATQENDSTNTTKQRLDSNTREDLIAEFIASGKIKVLPQSTEEESDIFVALGSPVDKRNNQNYSGKQYNVIGG
jgi:predicted kinase/transcriptional regulator with XRE-family HTH domain